MKNNFEKIFLNADSRKSNADLRRFIAKHICENLRAICDNLRSRKIFLGNFLKFWLPLYGYAILIFILSSNSKPPSIEVPFIDKVLHLIEYAIFGFLAARAFRNSNREALIRNFKILAIVCTFLYGISDELHQGLVPNRTAQISDLIMDVLGGLIGTYIYGGH